MSLNPNCPVRVRISSISQSLQERMQNEDVLQILLTEVAQIVESYESHCEVRFLSGGNVMALPTDWLEPVRRA